MFAKQEFDSRPKQRALAVLAHPSRQRALSCAWQRRASRPDCFGYFERSNRDYAAW
jgi:hypothetical protein